MFEWLGITPQALLAQLLVGLINGSFYAVLSMGLAIIFGLLNVINFTHGSQYMLGAFVAWLGLTRLGPWVGHDDWAGNYWAALVLSPLVVGAFGLLMVRPMLTRRDSLADPHGL